jgi:hypothetical protein
MTSSAEQDQVQTEIESVMRDHAIPVSADESDLPMSDLVMLREIALRVVHGDMDRELFSSLRPEMRIHLDRIVRDLIALKYSTAVQQLEEVNPHYSAFQSKVVRDGVKEGMKSEVMGLSRPSSRWLDVVLEMRQRRVALIEKLEARRKSKVFVFWNLDGLKLDDFFTLADFLEAESPDKDIDLVLVSPGGAGEAGYRIGHAFQQWTRQKDLSFRAIIPLYAKSAATILALGASEITMGLHSEIGPIDLQTLKRDTARNQWRYVPAMAVIDGLNLVAEHIGRLPEMSKFFEGILGEGPLSLDEIGLLERKRESGKQYAELLLMGGMIPEINVARATAERLSDYYKFHGHPIDSFEAEQTFSLRIKRSGGDEWRLIKDVRDEFQAFAGQPDIIPGVMVTSMVESAEHRSWRYIALEPGA